SSVFDPRQRIGRAVAIQRPQRAEVHADRRWAVDVIRPIVRAARTIDRVGAGHALQVRTTVAADQAVGERATPDLRDTGQRIRIDADLFDSSTVAARGQVYRHGRGGLAIIDRIRSGGPVYRVAADRAAEDVVSARARQRVTV